MASACNDPEMRCNNAGSSLTTTDEPATEPPSLPFLVQETPPPEVLAQQRAAAGDGHVVAAALISRVVRQRRSRSSGKPRAALKVIKQIIDGLPYGAFLVRGSDARLVMANCAALAAWGVIWEPGQPIQELLRSPRVCLPQEELADTEAGQRCGSAVPRQVLIRQADGVPHLFRVQTTALEADLLGYLQGKHTRASHASYPWTMLTLEDITALKEVEQLKQDVKALKEAEQLKDDFIATAAHELRSPLTTLIGYTEVLRQQTAIISGAKLAEWQVEALETIAHDTMRVVGLANDLLDVTRLQAGQFEVHCYSSDLIHLTQRVVARLQESSKAHTIVVDAPTSPLLVSMDTLRIEQVLQNLGSNAIKYSPQGGQIRVTVRAQPEAGVAELAVCDQGIGIPASQRRHIFSRFFRADNARIQGIEGTGLGLYLCRELIRLHGGRIWFESTEGLGSTFYIALPLAPTHSL
jgi:signal transduction histidine kinase